MTLKSNYLMYSPGGENEGSSSIPEDSEARKIREDQLTENRDEHHKPLGEKIKEALQDWSNKDQQDQNFDDTRV